MIRFNTRSDAIAAGYIPSGRSRIVERHRNGMIEIVDVSGGRSFGYEFALVAFGAIHITGGMVDGDTSERVGPQFAHTHTIGLDADLNKIGTPGCFTCMFKRDEYESGLAAARSALDAYTPRTIDVSKDFENDR